MRNLIFLIFWLNTLTTQAQIGHNSYGTIIISDLSWSEVKAKAIEEHKFILIDCNSTWCGPCKFLENRIFPLDTIGKLLNNKFLVVSVQFDTSANDNDFVKSWYATAQEFKREYGVTQFPTEIILDENAKPITKFCGVDTDDGISYLYDRIEESFQPQYQYFVLKQKTKSIEKLNSFELSNLAQASAIAGEIQDFNLYKETYLKSLTKSQFYSKDNFEFIVDNIHSTKDSLFDFVLENCKNIDTVVGLPIATERLSGIIYYEELKWKRVFQNAGNISANHYIYVEEPNWNVIAKSISKKYSMLDSSIILISKLDFYNLEHLDEKYFALILSKNSVTSQRAKPFTSIQIFTFLNKILTIKGTDRFWLTKGMDWLESLDGFIENSKMQRYKSALQMMLKKLPNL